MNKKKKCECCPRIIRISKLHKNKITGQMLCSFCNNKIGQNKFYTPSARKERISSYSITETEKQVLMRGKNREQIKKLCSDLRRVAIQSRLNRSNKRKQNVSEIINKKEINKKFIEGLK